MSTQTQNALLASLRHFYDSIGYQFVRGGWGEHPNLSWDSVETFNRYLESARELNPEIPFISYGIPLKNDGRSDVNANQLLASIKTIFEYLDPRDAQTLTNYEKQRDEFTSERTSEIRQRRYSECVFHRRAIHVQDNLVFVLMPFTEKWSDYVWREEIKPTVESIESVSFVCRRADDLFGHDVMQDVYESIVAARIVIAEVTNRNPNVFYELGMAHTLGKDVILLSQGTEHIPFDLNRFRHCIYSNDGPGYKILRSYLISALGSFTTVDDGV